MTIDAIFENGVFRPVVPVDLPEGEHVVLNVPERNSTRAIDEAERRRIEREIREILGTSYDTGDPDFRAAGFEPLF